MSLIKQLDADLIAAMKAGESEKLSVLRMARTALKNKQIEVGHELAEPEVVAVLQKELKQRREAATEFRAGNRPELAEKEEREAEILKAYLPAEMTDDELTAIVDDVIVATGAATPADMGKVMGQAMGKVAGRADGNRVSALVRQKLGA